MTPSLLYQWTEELATHLQGLNSWQVENLALFSHGVMVAESSQQMAIARKVVCGEDVASTARRLRRFIANKALPLQSLFSEWTRFVISRMVGATITLLVDETKLMDRFGVMLVGVAYEGRCIPLAWEVYPANDAEAYPQEGQVGLIERLLLAVKAGMPANRSVLVLADRGIGTSPELCRRVAALTWFYLFRVTKQSKIITDEGEYTIYEQVETGETWGASGLIFKQRGRIPAHARAIWDKDCPEPWALVTNDPRLTGHEYARRNWQEQSFRDLKSGGWQWEGSRLRCPAHMSHLVLILTVAYAWTVGLGSYAVHWGKARPLIRNSKGQLRRQWSLFKEGLQFFYNYVQRYGVGLKPCFVPDQRLL